MSKRPPPDYFGLTGALLLDGKFRVERVVAEGGFAVVYRATQTILERPIALKVLKPPADVTERARAAFLEAFVREARTIAKINHPHIVQVLDFGVSVMPAGGGAEAPWMALEWLEGQTLREELAARRGAFRPQPGVAAPHPQGRAPAEVLAMVRPVLEALAYAHQAGIAHRDIKPANVMLVPGRRGPSLKLLDFGIAKVMADGEADDPGSGETRTQSPFTAYSLHYAAPEQLGGMRTGPWTDVHAMALIITELLTDQPPLSGGDRTEICSRILSPSRPTPASFGVDVGAWEEVLATALNLRGAERFNNAGAFLAALEATVHRAAATTSAPVAAAAPGASEPGPAATAAASMPAPLPPTRAFAAVDPTLARENTGGGHTTLRGAVTTTDARAAAARGARARWAVALVAAVALVVAGGALVSRATRDARSNAASAPPGAPPQPPQQGAAPVAAPVAPGASNVLASPAALTPSSDAGAPAEAARGAASAAGPHRGAPRAVGGAAPERPRRAGGAVRGDEQLNMF